VFVEFVSMPLGTKLMKDTLPLAGHKCFADTPEAQLRVATVTTMAATLVHEVNQPLTAAASSLSACARRLRARGEGNADILAMLDHATQETLKAGEIIRRTRNFVISGRISPERENLRTMVERAILMLGERRESVGITTKVPLHLFVKADRLQIEQALANLLLNACESLAGREDGWIELDADQAGDEIVVTVADNGPGLDRPAPLSAPSGPGGAGLAIAVTALIAATHGGSLSAENRDEGGARFVLTLPAAD
jgi:two-component system sensor kinase FixL